MSILVVLILVLGMFYGAIVIAEKAKAEKRRQAERAYRDGLEQLKAAPTDPELREQTLHLGRVFSELTRDDKSVTIYDEVAIMNDINAVCAAAAAAVDVASSSQPSADSIEDRLRRLDSLREQGLISEQEHQRRKDSLLLEI